MIGTLRGRLGEFPWLEVLVVLGLAAWAASDRYYAQHLRPAASYAGEVIPMMVEWLRTLVLRGDDIEVRADRAAQASVRYIGGSPEGAKA